MTSHPLHKRLDTLTRGLSSPDRFLARLSRRASTTASASFASHTTPPLSCESWRRSFADASERGPRSTAPVPVGAGAGARREVVPVSARRNPSPGRRLASVPESAKPCHCPWRSRPTRCGSPHVTGEAPTGPRHGCAHPQKERSWSVPNPSGHVAGTTRGFRRFVVSGSCFRVRYMVVRLTPRTSPIAATVISCSAYMRRAVFT